MNTSLYREESLRHAGEQHFGAPVLSAMNPALVISFVLAILIAVTASVLAGTEFESRQQFRGTVDERTVNRLIARDFGFLSELYVREGATVSNGDVLGKITDRARRRPPTEEIARQLAMLDDLEALTTKSLGTAEAHARQEKQKLKEILVLTAADINLQERKVTELEQQVERYRSLHERGFLSSLEHLRFRQSLISEQQALNALRQQHAGTTARQLAVQAALDNRRQALNGKLVETRLRRSELRRIHAAAMEKHEWELVATKEGEILRIEVLQGTYLTPGQTILQIRGSGQPWSGTMQLPSRSLTHAGTGSRLQLSFDAYPPEQFGRLQATVLGLAPAGTATGDGMYIARLDIHPGDGAIAISPGMTFTAYVTAEKRTLLAWLLQPLAGLGLASRHGRDS